MIRNLIDEVRPTATFDGFEITDETQHSVVKNLRKLADSIVAKGDEILKAEYPFDFTRVIILWGKPGRGKTHLIEAFINRITGQRPDLGSAMFLFRGNFTVRNIAGIIDFDNLPILILDDIFTDKQDISELHPNTDVQVMMEFVRFIYEKRKLVVMTCNFPFKDGIVERIAAVDKIDRTISRLREITGNFGEMELKGPDYREILAGKKSAEDLFHL